MTGYVMRLREVWGSQPLVIAGATTLIFDDQQRILLQQRSDNRAWALPGGSLEPGETLEQTACRETREEVGLTLTRLSFFRMFSGPDFYYVYPNGDQAYNLIAAFVAHDWSGALRADADEVLDLKFFALDALPAPLSPPDAEVIRCWQAEASACG